MRCSITPYRNFGLFDQEFDNLFSRLLWSDQENARTVKSSWSPVVDVEEFDQEIVLRVELPGLKKDNIGLKVENRVLHVSGEREIESQIKSDGSYLSESLYGKFNNCFQLPERVDVERISASHENGLLTVKLPKNRDAQARQINIR